MGSIRLQPTMRPRERRMSVFMEVGLIDEATIRQKRSPTPLFTSDPSAKRLRPERTVRFRSQNDVIGENGLRGKADSECDSASDGEGADYDSSATMELQVNQQVHINSKMYRLGLLMLVLAFMLPVLHSSPLTSIGVRAGVVRRRAINEAVAKREDTNTNVCKRWAHQSAVVNGTLYMYGGRSSTSAEQVSDTWNNDFLTLDLTKSWQISNPSLTGLPRPSGPPKISMGYLWNSYESLFLYGGEFSDDPVELPTAFSTWEYQIGAKQWVEHKEPKTEAGDKAVAGGQPVQRSAEGAGFGVSTLGRGWYFGGHLDYLTTEGWSVDIQRIYLKSLIEFTFPGHTNKAVESLSGGNNAGEGGVYRNITEGGLQDTAGFTERADGLLLYVPGFGDEGILLGLTGGINSSFTQMNVIDVYDIAKSTWYKQTTSGKMPIYRVNPCAVVAAAADGSSYNVYMFGGQKLQPYKEQEQYDDMWILSIPSFTWIPVDMSTQSVPYGRSGHTCHLWDSQMIVVGGYVGQELSCDSPGIYVFNTSSLTWSDQFTALTGERATQHFDGSQASGNPLAQQANQRGFDADAGLEGSYGYAVPKAVQDVIGGQETGGATLTAPIQTPTEGPLATGKPHTYTVTGPNGAIITETSTSSPSFDSSRGTNVGAIVAGVIAGVFAVVAAYFAFCTWVYRKQVKIWKDHAAMVTARVNAEREKTGTTGTFTSSSGGKNSSDRAARDALFPVGDGFGAGGIRMSEENRIAALGLGRAGTAGRSSESARSSTEDLLAGQEPTFWGTRGVLLNPRRSLRVINRD